MSNARVLINCLFAFPNCYLLFNQLSRLESIDEDNKNCTIPADAKSQSGHHLESGHIAFSSKYLHVFNEQFQAEILEKRAHKTCIECSDNQ